MVLSGTLREYILADVFQLLKQQKITGKLILNSGINDGFVIFKNGQIIYAEKDSEKLQEKILNYLNNFSTTPVPNLNELFTSFDNNIHGLSLELIKNGFLTKDEISSLSESIIEDICCSLFLWKSGSYRFTSLRQVDDFSPLGRIFPVENIVMEAIRRSDEWIRMQEFVNKEVVFVRTNKEIIKKMDKPNALKQPDIYILNLVDGTSPVSEIVKDNCLSEYRIYEILYNHYMNQTVIPLSEQYTRSVQAALEQKKREQSSSPFSSIVAVACAFSVFIVTVICTPAFINSVILNRSFKRYQSFKSEVQQSFLENKLLSAHLYYYTLNGERALHNEQLFHSGLIKKHEAKILNKEIEPGVNFNKAE